MNSVLCTTVTSPVWAVTMSAARVGTRTPFSGGTPGDRLSLRAIKVVADGALGSRGALLGAPYSDDPHRLGLATFPLEQLRSLAGRALEKGLQIRVHAIGDSANHGTLDVFETVFGGRARPEARWAIEHAQIVRTDDVARFAACATNEERFAALTTMLTSRKLAFTLEPFKIERPLRGEPRTEGRNVVVTLGEGRKEIVIGAHYDAARLPDGSLSKGAVDNAASTVMLGRLAEVLAVEKLPVRIRQVWFDMEELGLIGSQQYVQNHTSDSISAMLNFDINAYGNTILFGPSDRQDNVELRRTLANLRARLRAS